MSKSGLREIVAFFLQKGLTLLRESNICPDAQEEIKIGAQVYWKSISEYRNMEDYWKLKDIQHSRAVRIRELFMRTSECQFNALWLPNPDDVKTKPASYFMHSLINKDTMAVAGIDCYMQAIQELKSRPECNMTMEQLQTKLDEMKDTYNKERVRMIEIELDALKEFTDAYNKLLEHVRSKCPTIERTAFVNMLVRDVCAAVSREPDSCMLKFRD